MDYESRKFYGGCFICICGNNTNSSSDNIKHTFWVYPSCFTLPTGDLMPSISISISNEIYQLLIKYRNEHGCTQSSAGAALIKMGFAWHVQTEEFLKEQKEIRAERNAIKTATVDGITKVVKDAQKPRVKVKVWIWHLEGTTDIKPNLL